MKEIDIRHQYTAFAIETYSIEASEHDLDSIFERLQHLFKPIDALPSFTIRNI